jgi:putative phosphoesterase
MTRIGVLADNHSRTPDGSDLPQAVLDAFAGVDLIVHCGDCGAWGALDRLETVAPVVGVLGGHNGDGDDRRIQGKKRVIDAGGLRAGIAHDLVALGLTTESAPAFKPTSPDLAKALTEFFGEPIDILLYAGTHVPRIAWASGMLLVNGGSPTIPLDRPRGSLGAVAIVEVTDGIASATVVDLAKVAAPA